MSDTTEAFVLSLDDVLGITVEVWATYLDAADELVERAPGKDAAGADPVSASVSVAGAWVGHIAVATTWSAARAIAAAMLGIPSDEVTEADVCDAVGEVANVVGGNVKSTVPDPSTLSLPVVARGAELMWPEAREVVRAELAWGDEPVTVSVWSARSEAQVPAPRKNP